MGDPVRQAHSTTEAPDSAPATLEPRTAANPAAIYLAGRTAASRRTMTTALKTLAELLQDRSISTTLTGDEQYLAFSWAALRRPEILQLRDKLRQRYAPATANKLLVALRGVLRAAHQLGQLSLEEAALALDIPPIPEHAVRHRRVLSAAEVLALHSTCAADQTPAGARDAAILVLLTELGLRRAEATALDIVDVQITAGKLVVRGGRGGVPRTVELTDKAKHALERWIAVRGAAAGPLLYGLVKGGGLVSRRLAPQAVAVICTARAAAACIPAFTPDDLRRTFLGSTR